MRRRSTVLLVTVAVAVVAVGSTAHATRREHAADRAARAKALKGAGISLVPMSEIANVPDLPRRDPSYPVSLRNDSPGPVVVRSVSWYDGLTAPVDAPVQPGEVVTALMPQPPCPTKRATKGPGAVTVTWLVGGVVKTTDLRLEDQQDPVQQANSACGLYPANQYNASTVRLVRSTPGTVVVDVRVAWTGKRDVVVRALRAADGVDATVAEALPITSKAIPETNDFRDIPHLLTVTLHVTDCARLAATVRPAEEVVGDGSEPPVYNQLQLDVQHPGDDPERMDLALYADATNALTAPCRSAIPALTEDGGNTGDAGGIVPVAG